MKFRKNQEKKSLLNQKNLRRKKTVMFLTVNKKVVKKTNKNPRLKRK